MAGQDDVRRIALSLPGVVYSVHMYLPHAFTHQGVFNKQSKEYRYPGPIEGTTWNKAALEKAMQGHIVAQCELVGYYRKK